MNEGLTTETEALYLASTYGINVSLPFGGQCRYDQIWDVNGKLYKIQIKRCTLNNTGTQIKFYCQAKTKYEENEIDALVTVYNGKVYFIPFAEINSSAIKSLTLFLTKETAMNYKQVNWAEDYEIEKQLEI